MFKRLLLLLIIAHVIMDDLSAQNFREGLYLTAKDFINQKPILREYIWIGDNHPNSYSEILSVVRIEYARGSERKKLEDVFSNIFGYYEAETLSIIFEGHLYKVTVTGTLTEIDTFVAVHGGGINKNGPYSTVSRVKKHLVFNAKTGKTINVDDKSVKSIFKIDKELYQKYNAIKKEERLAKLADFIVEYNKKYPL